MKGNFKIKKLKDIVRNAKVGSKGFILINPLNTIDDGTSFLTQKYFIFSTGLIYFKTVAQAEEYRKCIDAEYLYIVGLERFGKEFNEKGFTLDLTADPNHRKTSFNLSILPKDDFKLYISNGKYIVIKNPIVVNKPFSIEEFLSELKISIKHADAQDFDENEYDYQMIILDNEKIKILGDISLKYSLARATESDEFELARKIKLEIDSRKQL